MSGSEVSLVVTIPSEIISRKINKNKNKINTYRRMQKKLFQIKSQTI